MEKKELEGRGREFRDNCTYWQVQDETFIRCSRMPGLWESTPVLTMKLRIVAREL
jgi:hypothetical protein